MVQFREGPRLERFCMYSKYREQDLKNMSSLERVPDYRRFGLERFHCTLYTYAALLIHRMSD